MKVFIASFLFVVLAEMGDKTQLATVALAAKYQSIIPIWMGTTAAMLAADAFGIIVGVVLGKRIPERFVKWFAATLFILFGLIGLYDAVPEPFLTPTAITLAVLMILIPAGLVARQHRRREIPAKENGTGGATLPPAKRA